SETLHGNHPSLESRRATLFLGANPLTVTGGNGLRLGSQCSGRGGLTASAVRAQPRKPESTTGTRAKGARDRSAAAQREAARAARVGPGCRGPSATAGSGEQGAAPRFRAGPSRERWASPAVGGWVARARPWAPAGALRALPGTRQTAARAAAPERERVVPVWTRGAPWGA